MKNIAFQFNLEIFFKLHCELIFINIYNVGRVELGEIILLALTRESN